MQIQAAAMESAASDISHDSSKSLMKRQRSHQKNGKNDHHLAFSSVRRKILQI